MLHELRWQFVFVMADTRCLTDLDSVCRAVQDLDERLSMRLRFVDLPQHRSLFSLPSSARRRRKA